MATTPASYGSKYNFTYPKHQFEETVATSYKDTIDVSWTTTAARDHLPVLHMACWFRNDSADCKCSPTLGDPILNLSRDVDRLDRSLS